jgi:type IV secretory pathway VirJ component
LNHWILESLNHCHVMRSRNRSESAAGAPLAVLLTAALSGGCSAALSTKVSQPDAVREFSAQVGVHDEALTLHLASPHTPVSASTPLVLYASGDGGWFGAAAGMFHTIASRGLPTVGFSTKAFMRIEHRWSRPLNVAHVVEGYQRVIDAARAQLRLSPDAPVVLTGWSRGASLGVLVASSREADPRVVGLVAVGLPADEQLDIRGGSDDDAGEDNEVPAVVNADLHARSIAMYPLLSRIAPRRMVVIQASGDGYLPAARARELFGSDSSLRRLVAIDARNHRFSGGESRFAAALVEAVGWVSSIE